MNQVVADFESAVRKDEETLANLRAELKALPVTKTAYATVSKEEWDAAQAKAGVLRSKISKLQHSLKSDRETLRKLSA